MKTGEPQAPDPELTLAGVQMAINHVRAETGRQDIRSAWVAFLESGRDDKFKSTIARMAVIQRRVDGFNRLTERGARELLGKWAKSRPRSKLVELARAILDSRATGGRGLES